MTVDRDMGPLAAGFTVFVRQCKAKLLQLVDGEAGVQAAAHRVEQLRLDIRQCDIIATVARRRRWLILLSAAGVAVSHATGAAKQGTTRGSSETPAGKPMKIRFLFPNATYTATLLDGSAARDLIAMLPLRLEVSDFASAEKIAYLPRQLDIAGAPPGTSATAGDIAYYAPWGNLALFYKPAPHASGLVRLGRIDGDIGTLAGQPKGVLTVERVPD